MRNRKKIAHLRLMVDFISVRKKPVNSGWKRNKMEQVLKEFQPIVD